MYVHSGLLEAHTCRSRGALVACTRMYDGQGARMKIRPRMCTYGRGLECLLTHTYGQGSCTWLGRNGETTSSSCSWGANRLGWNGMCCCVHREGLDGTGDGNEAWRTAKRTKQPCVRPATFKTGVLLIGRGLAYRKTEETDLLRSKRGSY